MIGTTPTPTPWTQDTLLIKDANGVQIAHCTRWEDGQPRPHVAEANAEFIVQAANDYGARDERLAALVTVLSTFRVGIPCQETTDYVQGEKDGYYIRCNHPSIGVVWHEKDRRAYPMCRMCLDHNVDNRGGLQLR